MPIYEYEGKHYDLDTTDQDEAKNKILEYLGKSKPKGPKVVAEDASDFSRGIGNIIPQTENVYESAKALTGVVAKKMGFNETGDRLIKSGLKGMEDAEARMEVKESDDFLKAWEKGIGTVVTDWLPYQAGAGVGSLLETLAFMGIGAVTGAATGAGVGAAPGAVAGAVSKSLIKKGVKEAAEALAKKEGKEAAEKYIQTEAKKVLIDYGKNIGIGSMAGMHGLGEVGGRAIEEAQEKGLRPEDIQLDRVLPAAAVHAVADFVGEKIMLGALKADPIRGKSLALDIAKRIGTTGIKELGPEEIQTIAERYGADLSLADAEAIREYVNTAAASFGMSVVPGATGALHTRFTGKLKEETQAAKEDSDKKKSSVALEKAANEVDGVKDPAILAKLQPTVDENGVPLAKESPTTTQAVDEVNQVIQQGDRLNAEQKEEQQNVAGPTNLRGTDTGAGGVGAAIPSGQQTVESTTGATRTDTGGVGTTTPATTTTGAGAQVQQPALTQSTSQAAPPPVATPAFTPAAPQQTQQAAPVVPQKTKQTTVTGDTTTVKEKKVAKPIKTVGEVTEEPSAQNFLNKTSFYGNEAPTTQERGVEVAGFDHAFDAFDTVDYTNKILPKIKEVMAQRNKEQEEKRQAVRQRMETEGRSKKDIQSELAKIKKFNERSPLEFMSLEDLVQLYKENIGSKEMEEGGDARKTLNQDRNEFIKGLSPLERAKVNMVFDRAFAQEVNQFATTGTTSVEERAKSKQKQKAISDVEEQVKSAKRTEEEADVILEKRAERVAQYKEEKATEAQATEASKVTKEKGKTKFDKKIEQSVATNDVEEVLKTVSDRELNDRRTARVAKEFNKLLKLQVVETNIQFGEVLDGDGQFDPATNTITLKGSPETGYTGKRRLDEVVMHEISHATLDHVFDNPKAYIKSLPAADRPAAQAALNRLAINHKLAVTRFGKKYNIATMKEFAAEFWSNGNFQNDLMLMSSPTPYSKKENFFTTIVKNIANAIGISKEFKEIAEDLAILISVPTEEIKGKEVSFAEAKKPEFRETDLYDDAPEYDVKEKDKPKNVSYFKKLFFTRPGLRLLATKFQNSRYNIKHWQDQLDLAGKVIDDVKGKINNIYTQLTLAASLGRNYYDNYVKDADDRLQKSILDFAKASGLDTDKALNRLFRILEALHEGERRHEKYLKLVPLNNNNVLNNGTLSPAARRTQIYELLDENIKLSDSQVAQLKAELETLVKKYADPLGSSPRTITNKDGTITNPSLDEQNEQYNVAGISPAARDLRIKQFNELPAEQKKAADEVIASLKDISDATIELNRMGNYFSQPVSNRIRFYNFENYVTLKGLDTKEDEDLEYHSKRMGAELQEMEHTFEGRTTVGDNPILQMRSDATRAALRAGRKDLTQSIKNSIKSNKYNPDGQGLLAGEVVEHLTFAERAKLDPKSLKGETKIFHYNEDGSVDIIQINDKAKLEAIRRTYQDTNPIIDVANKVTSFFGAMHTRYNFNFAPMNFVRDALTNAFTMSAEMGPIEAARYIKAITGRSMQGGMMKAVDISVAYEKGDMKAIESLKKDPIAADMIEFIERGGMVSYLQGLSIKSNFQTLQKELGRNNIIKKKEQLDKFIDIWTDMFELSSRSAAYAVVKRHEMAKNKSEEAATVRAVAYAKNLANFEQVGDWGKSLGALYMFFRPSATGAVRAIEAMAPGLDFRKQNEIVDSLPPEIRNDKEALKTYLENYAGRQRNARITMTGAMGLGMITYFMAQMFADDDDLGRNKVAADNMQQWTRFARFHIPESLAGRDDLIIQIPWGFGLGAFAASGAQIAGAISGKGSFGDAMWNIGSQISLDSFIPIPVSRMDPTDEPWAFVLDSVMPSTLRPILEFVINKNGLGQEIYSDRNRRMGDAYTGSDRVPEIYRVAARELADITLGGIDWSPNTMYFLANSYLDGISKFGEYSYSALDLSRDRKNFEFRTDVPIISSFLGAKSNYDSREFTKVENQIKEMERRLNMFKGTPAYFDYIAENPFAPVIVESYNKNVNGELKQLRAEANKIQRSDMTKAERQDRLDMIRFQQNFIKRRMIDYFENYGITP